MSKRPDIRLGQWITVNSVDCVVTNVYEIGSPLGDREVACIPEKPANRDVVWKNDSWHFVETSDFGGYAETYPRLRYYVQKLKRGR
jgi:hypothetical protein